MPDDTTQVLSEYIAKNILKQPGKPLAPETRLITTGMIDSFSLVDMALFIEETFRARIADTELDGKTFDTLGELAALVEKRRMK